MPCGYRGNVLRVNLSTSETWVEHPDAKFYRTYMGGRAVGAYYLLKEQPAGVDPLSPQAKMIVAPSVMTGAPAPGLSRYAIVARSPLTGAFGDSQAGGFFGPELKFAGFDAIVIEGRAAHPVYLWIRDGVAEVRDARHLWGKTTGETQTLIREEHGDPHIRMISIGPAGENKVLFANVLNECKHANGRCGMGAVMGSKNLKAVAVRGRQGIEMADEQRVKHLAKWFADNYMKNPANYGLHEIGTSEYLNVCNAIGVLPTKNFRTGYFPEGQMISGERMKETILVKGEGCFACPVRCKRVVRTGEPYNVDPTYGGPEFETLGALGACCEISG